MVCNTSATFVAGGPPAAGAGTRPLYVSLNGQDYDTVGDFHFHARPTLYAIDPTGGPTLRGYALTMRGAAFAGLLAVPGVAPLCRLGSLTGQVLSQTADGEQVVCEIPAVEGTTLPGMRRVSIALNGQNFDSGTSGAPHRYRYYDQQQWLVDPGGGPVGGGTVVTVHGAGFEGFDGQAPVAR